MIVAISVHILCMITKQNTCTHSSSCIQHYVNTPMQNIIMSAQNIIAGNLQLPHSQGVSESITNIDCVYPWRRFYQHTKF